MSSKPADTKRPRRKKSVNEDLYDQPGHLLRRANQIAGGLFAELVGRGDITPLQYAILRMVQEHPGIDQVGLARSIALDTSTTALTAARLQTKGLLNRDTHATDRRQLSLTLTEEGEALMDGLVDSVHGMRERLLAPLPPEERELFMELLRKFVHLNNDRSRAPRQE